MFGIRICILVVHIVLYEAHNEVIKGEEAISGLECENNENTQ